MLTRATATTQAFHPVDKAAHVDAAPLEAHGRGAESDSDSASLASSHDSELLINYAVSRIPEENEGVKSFATTRQAKDRRPPSTFYLKKRSEMNIAEKLCQLADTPVEIHRLQPADLDRGPPPYLNPVWDIWHIFWSSLPPLVVQEVCYTIWPNYRWPWIVQYPVFLVGLIHFAIQAVHRLNRYALKYGTLDEKEIGRDRTPDKSVPHLAIGIVSYVFVRMALPFVLHYDRSVAHPLFNFTWTFPLRLILWEIVLDYFFYVYHRSSHEVDALWFIMHHHTTKHPTHILSILAEEYQEMLEVLIVPSLASWLVPMTQSELYVALAATMWVEMQGHCGVRAHWRQPIASFILKYFDMDLAVEDHDMHHRGGKSGRNYGKQTRVWDKLYGTSAERIETYGMF
ncbi:BQ5605_C001g00049 [Microbotryum silenes-dioicae]|uniref:BQ5605_C001g00049 protein n=1 Tax=Microbotryum silenes-dioicae TaxID=796604 RepID=A0A2X0M5N8_9BASI|nr:BQ5605_C001g00049 [Microbotryum silenes-dioicae]